jgi:lactate dehydrogenase-like 2-hydroxyacid dehydrogenase
VVLSELYRRVNRVELAVDVRAWEAAGLPLAEMARRIYSGTGRTVSAGTVGRMIARMAAPDVPADVMVAADGTATFD